MLSGKSFRHAVLAAFLGLSGLALAPSVASADQQDVETGIVAGGSGQVRVRPDSVRIAVGVEAQGRTVDQVQREANAKMQQVLASLRALGIPNLLLQTRILDVSPVYATTPTGIRTAEIVGYSATNSVSVSVRKVPFDKLGGYASAILGAATHSGANVSNGLDLFLDDPSSAEALALENAVKDARRNAEIMAKAAGLTITGVALVRAGGAIMPLMFQAPQYGAVGGAPGAPVETGEVVVNSNVTVRFTFR